MTKSKPSLTAALTRLEEIAEQMNSGVADIETGLKQFEEAVELITFCREQLKQAENRFVTLKKQLDQEEY